MKSKLFYSFIPTILCVLLACSHSIQLGAQCTNINATDLAALQALYQSTDGDHWTDNTGWDQIMNFTSTSVCNLENIHGINFAGNRVNSIFMANNNLTGEIPGELGNLINLEWMLLHSNELTGPIPPELGNLTNLAGLDLSDNSLTGPIPPELGDLNNLQFVFLLENSLTGPIPTGLGNLTNLEQIALYSNELTGPIPPELGNLSNLEQLYLYNNELSGSIPPELGNLTNLERLSLSHNDLTGPIPPELGNLTNLEFLYLNDDDLRGSVPPELGNLTNLERLSLSHNDLTGPIPPELGNLTNLEWMRLYGNELNGPIPPELGNLSNLERLYLHDNDLSGCFHPNLRNLCGIDVRLDNSEFNFPWADFCDGLGGECNTDPCANTLHYFPQLCELPQQKIIDFALAASDCPIVEYTLTSHEGLPLPDKLSADRYEYCKPVLFSYKCQDGRTCEMYIIISSEFTTQEFVSMTIQEYLSGTTLYNVRGCPGTYTYEDEEQYRNCELTRIKRYWRYADFCGSYESGVQYIDIRDFFFCRFAGPFRLPEGIERWIRLDLPDKINLKGIKFHWSVKGLDWKILDQKGPALLVLPGKDIVEVGVEINFPTGLTLDVYGKFESYKPGFDKSKKRSQSTAGITAEEIEVFPNPARAQITIRCLAHQTGQQVQIINQLGVVVGENKIQGHEMNMSISDLSPGVYSLQVSDGTSFTVKRFVKM